MAIFENINENFGKIIIISTIIYLLLAKEGCPLI